MFPDNEAAEEFRLKCELDAAAASYDRARENYQSVLRAGLSNGFLETASRTETRARAVYLSRLEEFARFVLARTAVRVRMQKYL